MKHTQGEWKLGEYTKISHDAILQLTVEGKSIGRYQVAQSFDKEEAEANAKLIAAAPDLLEALQEVFQRLPNSKQWLDLNEKCLAAIKKATE